MSAYEVPSRKRGLDGDRRVAVEAEVSASYLDAFREQGMSLRFVEVAYKWYLASGIALYAIPSLVETRRTMDDEIGSAAVLEVTVDEGERSFEGRHCGGVRAYRSAWQVTFSVGRVSCRMHEGARLDYRCDRRCDKCCVSM